MISKHDVSEMVGLTLDSVTNEGDQIVFLCGADKYKLFHNQDCCESVYIDDICGDLQDLVGKPLLMAEEVSNFDDPPDFKPESYESYTWTFYKFATVKGYVTIRWFGESNGYYSESVDFSKNSETYHTIN